MWSWSCRPILYVHTEAYNTTCISPRELTNTCILVTDTHTQPTTVYLVWTCTPRHNEIALRAERPELLQPAKEGSLSYSGHLPLCHTSEKELSTSMTHFSPSTYIKTYMYMYNNRSYLKTMSQASTHPDSEGQYKLWLLRHCILRISACFMVTIPLP